MKSLLIAVFISAIYGVGCGGGSGSDEGSDILENGLLGGKSGAVALVDNGCAEYREIPITEVTFSHIISAVVVGTDRLDITFNDNGYVCNALNVDRYSGQFDGNCGVQPLVDFLAGFTCTQELVWRYSESSDDNPSTTADVIRTAYVRCSQGDVLQFACPVKYRGTATDCLRGICPQ